MRSRSSRHLQELNRRLASFVKKNKVRGKGALALVLVLTRRAATRKIPLDPEDFLTEQGGQVAGVSKSAVQGILKDHGISRVLAEEAGRTSRGSTGRMRAYVDFLNHLGAQDLLNFSEIEVWWVDRVREFFASQPFRLKLDPSKSIRHSVHELLDAAFKRQREGAGVMVAGAVMQHLVGAKLELMLPSIAIDQRGFSVADSPGNWKGDFLVHDTVIHVTTAPSEALLRKCEENLDQNLRPVIITTESGAGGAGALARNANLADRIDIFEIEQFVAANVYEISEFAHAKRPVTLTELVDKYNRIINGCESDPSLRISIGS